MQCTRTARRSVCGAHNAFNPALALRAAFTTASPCLNFYRPKFVNVDLPPRRVLTDRNTVKSLPADQFLQDAILALRRQELHLGRKQELNRDEWQKHVILTHDVAARLSRRDGREAFARLTDGQQQILLECLNYEPMVVAPRPSGTLPPTPIPWGLEPEFKAETKRGRRVLDGELWRFARYMELTPMEKLARKAVAEETMKFVKKHTLRTDVEPFGSEITGLASPLSDIDLRLGDSLNPGEDPYRMDNRMQHLARALRGSTRFGLVMFRSGQYPIINFQHMKSGISIQIVASSGAGPQQDVVIKYLNEFPTLRDLFPTIRTFFEMRGFNDVFSGGIGSYGQFVMLVAAIARKNPIEKLKGTPPNLADHFLRFLHFWSKLNSSKYGVSVSPRNKFMKHEKNRSIKTYVRAAERRGDMIRAGQWSICERKEHEPHLLCIQDPATPTNDLGKRSSSAKHILHTMNVLREDLRRAINMGRFRDPSYSVLEPFVGRCHETYHERRQQMEEYGAHVAKKRAEAEERHRAEAQEQQQRQEASKKTEVEREDFYQQMQEDAEQRPEAPRREASADASS